MLKIYKTSAVEKKTKKVKKMTADCWIDLIVPTTDEIDKVVNRTGVDKDLIMKLLDTEELPRVEQEDNATLIVIDIPHLEEKGEHKYKTYPLGIIITNNNYIITVTVKKTTLLNDFKRNIVKDFRTAKFAEIYTSAKQFFTLPDMFGMSERINISGKYSENNWTVRIPTDYERFYFSQLSNGFGLNIPKVFSVAMRMKEGAKNEQLIEKCQEAAEILRQKGPMTEEEANKWQAEGKLTNKFEYVA